MKFVDLRRIRQQDANLLGAIGQALHEMIDRVLRLDERRAQR